MAQGLVKLVLRLKQWTAFLLVGCNHYNHVYIYPSSFPSTGVFELMMPLDPGTYNTSWKVEARPDPNCDPTQQPCEQWEVGDYTAEVGMWGGICFDR